MLAAVDTGPAGAPAGGRPPAAPGGELRGIRTRFGAELDLTWSPTEATAVLRPTRTHRVELRTSSGAEQLDLVAGEDHVLRLEAW